MVDIDIAPINVSDSGVQTKLSDRRVQTSLSQGSGCGVLFVASVRKNRLDITVAVLVTSFCRLPRRDRGSLLARLSGLLLGFLLRQDKIHRANIALQI
jgi:hypothetical protein